MRPNPNRGRVYRRCACRDTTGKQIGARCPKLSNPRHGTWAFAVDRPNAENKRKTMRRSGFATRTEANEALRKVLECERAGIHLNDAETVAQYLTSWLDAKAPNLRPNTVLRYGRTSTRTSSPRSAPSGSSSSPTNTSGSSSATSLPSGAGESLWPGASPRCPAPSTTPSNSGGSPTAQRGTQGCPGHPAGSSPAGPPGKPKASCAPATASRIRWPTCSS